MQKLPVHQDQEEKCDKWLNVFGSKSDLLVDHLNMVHIEKEYECQECNKLFKKKNHLMNHQIIHTDQELSCISCGRDLERLLCGIKNKETKYYVLLKECENLLKCDGEL